MTAAQAFNTKGTVRSPSRLAWLPVAAVLLGTGWGSNQFTPLLLVYRHALGVSTGTLEAMFGAYALGLIPGLLLAGPLSDSRGRRAVVIPAAVLSLVASLVLVAGADSVALLFVGRLLAGVSSGAVFSAGTAWLRETSLPPVGTASHAMVARRAAIAMTAGFALGPLVAGLLAQWAPAPRVVAYVPHIALMAVVLVLRELSLRRCSLAPDGRCACECPGYAADAFAGLWHRWRRGCSPRPRSRSRYCQASSAPSMQPTGSH